jgi:hypothetical protein
VRPRGARLDRVEHRDEQAGALDGEPFEQVAGVSVARICSVSVP